MVKEGFPKEKPARYVFQVVRETFLYIYNNTIFYTRFLKTLF